MLGEKIGEVTGKVIVRRVLGSETGGPMVEVSFQTTGKLLGQEISEIGTYMASMRQGGALYGEGQGMLVSTKGETIAWKGSGIGKMSSKGMGASYRGCLYYETTAPNFAKLNGMCAVFEYEADENGNTKSQIWEWR